MEIFFIVEEGFGCNDPECCGGPSKSEIRFFSSKQKAIDAGFKEENIRSAILDAEEVFI